MATHSTIHTWKRMVLTWRQWVRTRCSSSGSEIPARICALTGKISRVVTSDAAIVATRYTAGATHRAVPSSSAIRPAAPTSITPLIGVNARVRARSAPRRASCTSPE